MPAKRKQPVAADDVVPTPIAESEPTAFESESEDESSAEDETEMSAEKRAELLKGFDSDSDSDDDAQNDEDNRIIELSNLTPTISTAISKKKKVEESGILYVGRIPHGFYEEEMTSYFSQFGTILNLRMSRSKKTGRSKHYAFIEFGDRGVAEIVAQTMHNYLLASHLLQVILLTPEEFQKKGGRDLFKGAGRKFKSVPWAQIAKDRVESAKTKEQWDQVEKRETKRRSEQQKKLKAAGIDYEYETPAAKKLKSSENPRSIKPKKENNGVSSRKASGASARKASGSRKVSVK